MVDTGKNGQEHIIGEAKIKCVFCGHENFNPGQFCEECGKTLVVPKLSLSRCPKCAYENPRYSRFCEDCGERLVTLKAIGHKSKSLYDTIPLKIKRVIPKTAIGIICLIILLTVIKAITNPIHIVENYYSAIAKNDFGKMYSCYGDFPESEFVNKKLYLSLNEVENDTRYNGKIINFQIEEDKSTGNSVSSIRSSASDTADKIVKYYTVAYTVSGSSQVRTERITLIKQKTKRFLFFDKWGIAIDNIVADDFQITVPKGANVTLNGIEVSSKYLQEFEKEASYNYYYMDMDNSKYDSYLIPNILVGRYDLVSQLSYTDPVKQAIYVENYGETALNYGYYLSKNVTAELKQKNVDVVSQVCNAIASNLDFSAISNLFAESARENAKYNYDRYLENYQREGYKLISFSNMLVADSENNAERFEISNGQVYVGASYDYNYTMEVYKGRASSNEFEYKEYSSSTSMYVRYVYEDDQWLLADFINIPPMNY